MGTLRERCFDLGGYGDRAVLVGTHRALDADAMLAAIRCRAGALLGLGIQPGDRVACLGPTDVDAVIDVLAVQFAGAIAVPLCPRHTAVELQHVLEDSGSSLVLADASMIDRVAGLGVPVWSTAELRDDGEAPACDRDDESIALLIYTSGTTGRSKGVALSWRALVSNMSALGTAWSLGPADRCSVMLPLFHVHGLCIGIYAMLLASAAIVLRPKFDAGQLVEDVRDRGTTVFLGVPTMYVALVEHLAAHPDETKVLRRARLFTAGSAALSPTTLAAFEAATGHRILERYGMTETLITLSNPLVGERRPGRVGRPIAGVQARIVGDDGTDVMPGVAGELQVRGNSLMTEYWGNPEATTAAFADGWFRTGDIAVVDVEGTIAIVGRASTDIVKSGGFKISTLEIETALREHAMVEDVAVLGVPDPRWGERVAAAVVFRHPAALAEIIDALGQHCRERLADYKCPRQWIILDELGRNAMGKLEKTRLRARIEADYPGDADLRRTQNQ